MNDDDGSRGIMVKKPALTLIAVMVTVVIALSSVVAYTTEIRSDVDQNSRSLSDLKPRVSENRENVLVFNENIKTLNDKVDRIEDKVDKLLEDCEGCQSS